MNVADLLTGVRFVLVPVFLLALFAEDGTDVGWRFVAFGILAVAALTDLSTGSWQGATALSPLSA